MHDTKRTKHSLTKEATDLNCITFDAAIGRKSRIPVPQISSSIVGTSADNPLLHYTQRNDSEICTLIPLVIKALEDMIRPRENKPLDKPYSKSLQVEKTGGRRRTDEHLGTFLKQSTSDQVSQSRHRKRSLSRTGLRREDSASTLV